MHGLIELFSGGSAPVVKAPQWMEGMVVCPVLLNGHLWWDCAPILMVRGGPPSGVAFEHSEPHQMPEDFGPSGRAVQVIPAEKDASGILTLRDQLGDLRARCMWRHFKLANRMIDRHIRWFAYAPPDPDEDDKPPLVGMASYHDHFEPVAFVSQVAVSMNNFLTQEEIDGLPTFRGLRAKERGDA